MKLNQLPVALLIALCAIGCGKDKTAVEDDDFQKQLAQAAKTAPADKARERSHQFKAPSDLAATGKSAGSGGTNE